ncbi:MAG: DUF2225 domain-containing protein [Vallitalea sp.]|jgi:uncharacterized protein (DUF2225 family)|nr:DUF2225 domain-containing protein [Vallitalea sp.]
MSDIFSGLDKLGLNTNKYKLFEEEKNKQSSKVETITKKSVKDVLYDRKVMCPVCGEHIITKTVRSGKVKLISIDTDLRPKYDILTPYIYDVILCNKCGYAALNRFFRKITDTQASWIKKQISASYKGRKYPDEYTYSHAIERYKLALLNAVIKRVKASEKAYICLKIAWLYRTHTEYLLKENNSNQDIIKSNKESEIAFIEKAYKGFIVAYEAETFPVCGMEEITVMYLIGDLARRLGRNDEAMQWVSRVIVSKAANERLKERARHVKDLIKGKT